MSTSRRAKIVPILATTMLASTIVACSGEASSDEDPCVGATVSAGIVNSATDAVLFIAQDRGYFEDEGLTVEFVAFDSAAQMIAPLGSGQLDVGAGAPSAGFYNAVARDISLKIVADKGSLRQGFNYMPLLVRTDLVESGEVETIADLAGRTVAEPAQGTATSSTLATILEAGGLDYDDVEHQFVGFPEHLPSFQNGAIDAAMTTEPNATLIVERGEAVRFADSTEEGYDGQQLAVVLYASEFAEQEEEVAQCFMNGYLRGARDYSAAVADNDWNGPGGEEIVQIIADNTGIEAAVLSNTVPSFIDPDGAVLEDSLQRDYEFFNSEGMLEAETDLDTIVDTSFAQQAVEILAERNDG